MDLPSLLSEATLKHIITAVSAVLTILMLILYRSQSKQIEHNTETLEKVNHFSGDEFEEVYLNAIATNFSEKKHEFDFDKEDKFKNIKIVLDKNSTSDDSYKIILSNDFRDKYSKSVKKERELYSTLVAIITVFLTSVSAGIVFYSTNQTTISLIVIFITLITILLSLIVIALRKYRQVSDIDIEISGGEYLFLAPLLHYSHKDAHIALQSELKSFHLESSLPLAKVIGGGLLGGIVGFILAGPIGIIIIGLIGLLIGMEEKTIRIPFNR